jgi:hypothetical protein
MACSEHGVGLADARRHPQVDAQPSARAEEACDAAALSASPLSLTRIGTPWARQFRATLDSAWRPSGEPPSVPLPGGAAAARQAQ